MVDASLEAASWAGVAGEMMQTSSIKLDTLISNLER